MRSSSFADSDSAPALSYPIAVAADALGSLYVADSGNHVIKRISPAGEMTILAGMPGVAGDVDGVGVAARFRYPSGVAVDIDGTVYVADTANSAIRRIDPGGVVSTVAGKQGEPGVDDGPADLARFGFPTGLALDVHGVLYIADSSNHAIRRIGRDGLVTTIAGRAGHVGYRDGPAHESLLWQPWGLAVDSAGRLIFSDSGSHTIRMLSTDGVTTLFGSAGSRGSRDGNADQARFDRPTGISIDARDRIFVTDSNNHTLRMIDGAEVVTIGGKAGSPGTADGIEGSSRFNYPFDVEVLGDDRLAIVELIGHALRIATETRDSSRRRGISR
ncbi:MAG TPA: hypothetical protein VMT00_03110 [Thermoanaerobaculia bacterium]|nr:hypothetical protein [Thermoanaerobaculia bacterium]